MLLVLEGSYFLLLTATLCEQLGTTSCILEADYMLYPGCGRLRTYINLQTSCPFGCPDN